MKTNSLEGLIKVADQIDIMRRNQQQGIPDWDPPTKSWDEKKQDFKNAWVNVGYPLLKTIPDTIGDVLNGVRYGANSLVNGVTGYGWDGTSGITGYVPPDSTARLHDGFASQPIVADAIYRAVDTGATKVGDLFRSKENKLGPTVERANAIAHDKLRKDLYWNPDAYKYNKNLEDLEAQVMELLALHGLGGAGSAVSKAIPQTTAASRYAAAVAKPLFPMAFDATYRAGITPSYSGMVDTSRRTDGSEPFFTYNDDTYVPPVIDNYTEYFDLLKFLGPLAASGAGWAAGKAGFPAAREAFSRVAAFMPRGSIEGTMTGMATGHGSAADDFENIRRRNFNDDPDSPFQQRQMELAHGDEDAKRLRAQEYERARMDAAKLQALSEQERSAAYTDALLSLFFPMLEAVGPKAYALPAGAAAARAGYDYMNNGYNSVPTSASSK